MVSLERLLAIKLTSELETRFPRFLGRAYCNYVEGDPPKTVECVNARQTLAGLLEDNGKTGYLYLLDVQTRGTVAACWLYNRIPAPSLNEALAYADRCEAPPLPRDVQLFSMGPPWKYVLPTTQVWWNPDQTAVFVRFRKNVLGAIAWDGFAWKRYPSQLMEACKWGEPLSKEVSALYSLK